jgi:hypothetical protein
MKNENLSFAPLMEIYFGHGNENVARKSVSIEL